MLFNSNSPDNALLLLRTSCWPDRLLGTETRKHIGYQRWLIYTKRKFLAYLSADLCTFQHNGASYQVKWALNAIPSEDEWERRLETDFLKIELRTSHLLQKPVAIIEWQSRKFNLNIPV